MGSLEKELMMTLIGEVQDHRILDIGCGTGNYLKLFQTLGSKPFGVDISIFMLQKAKEKDNFKLILGKGDQLPIKDKVFEITILVTTLEFCDNPTKVLWEANRVTTGKIFIGALNRWSAVAVGRRIKAWFRPSIYSEAHFFSIWELKQILKGVIRTGSFEWRGVHFLPFIKIRFLRWLDRKLSFRKNPFSAFLGVLVTLNPA